jgi:phage-related protein
MIENIQPKALIIGSIFPGYTKAYITHSTTTDEDVQGKVFWLTRENTVTIDEVTDLAIPNYTLNGLTPSSSYSIEGAFYDAMVDASMRTAKVGMLIGTEVTVSTYAYPTIADLSVTSTQVDIGVSTPLVAIQLEGYADTYYVEYSVDGVDWVPIANSSSSLLSFYLPTGSYFIRTAGVIILPSGERELSPYYQHPDTLVVTSGSSQPNAPTSVATSIGRIQDTFERYDVRVSWEWDRGDSGNIREFLVKGTILPNSTPINNESTLWASSQLLTSAGSSLDTVFANVPYGSYISYRVEALGYDNTVSYSDPVVAQVTEDNVDTNYVLDTSLEVTYSHVAAYKTVSGVKKQTFKVDAATGSVAIGFVDPVKGAPINIDPASGQLSVDGSVIADNINSANFILTPLTASDRPNIRTYNKTGYGDGMTGMYAGYATDLSSFQFEVGNATNYIRWNGNSLNISGSTVIGSGNTAASLDTIASRGTIYNQPISNFTTFNSTSASSYMQTLLGLSYVPEGTILTQYKTSDYSQAATAKYVDGVWDTTELIVNGDILATGTVTTKHLASDSVTTDKLVAKAITGDKISATTYVRVGNKAGRYAHMSGEDNGAIYAFAAGKSLIDDTGATAPYRVSHAGHLYAQDADITGHINATSMTFTTPEAIPEAIDNAVAIATANAYAASNFVDAVSYNTDIEAIQAQLDKSITSWFYSGVPTLANAPASSWTTAELRNVHLGDLYYDTASSTSYRFSLSDGAYTWATVVDSDASAALAAAAAAQDTADSKRRVFYATPVPPYDKGDLWDTGAGLKRCNTASTTTYSAGHWVSVADGVGVAASQAASALTSAKTYADAAALTAKTTANAYSDGILDDAEAYAIAQAQAKADAALLLAKEYTNDIDIGGTNLVDGTLDATANLVPAYNTTEKYLGLTVTQGLSTSGTKDIYTFNTGQLLTDTYTLSFYAKASVANSIISSWFYSPNDTLTSVTGQGGTASRNDGGINHTLTTSWARYSVTWTVGSLAALKKVIVARTTTTNSTISIAGVKLESGNKATAWTGSLNDIYLANKAYSDALASQKEITTKAYADGIVDDAEAAAIAEAERLSNIALQAANAAQGTATTANGTATTALNNAATAQTTANSKAKVFYATPTGPYSIGDLWDTGAGFKRATVAKTSGYTASNWTLITDGAGAAAAAQTAATNAATVYADAVALATKTTANAYSDGILDDAEAYAVAQAQAKADAALVTAKQYTDSIEVGGTNLVDGSADNSLNILPAYNTTDTYLGLSVAKFSNVSGSSYRDGYRFYTRNLKDTTYTLSFYAKAAVSNTAVTTYWTSPANCLTAKTSQGASNTNGGGNISLQISDVWDRYWITWTISTPDSDKLLYLARVSAVGVEISIAGVKFESGNQATAWTASLNDITNTSKAYADALASQKEITTKAYADGIVTASEAVAIAEAERLSNIALQAANVANSLAATKAKVFYTTPTGPYYVGDLWDTGAGIKRATVAKTSGYTASNWSFITDAAGSAAAAQAAAISSSKTYADAVAVVSKTTSEAYADGILDDAEAFAIAQAQAKADAALAVANANALAYADAAENSANDSATILANPNLVPIKYTNATTSTAPTLTPGGAGNAVWSDDLASTGGLGIGAIKMTTTGTGEFYVYLGSSSTDYNISINKTYHKYVSAWVYSNKAGTMQLYLKASTGMHVGATVNVSVSSGSWSRISAVLDLTGIDANTALLRIDSELDNAIVYVNNIQVEDKIAGMGQPSAFKPGAVVPSIYPDQDSIQLSGNYVAGVSGWALDAYGNVEFNNGVFRGTVSADKIDSELAAGIIKQIPTVNRSSNGTDQTYNLISGTVGTTRSTRVRYIYFPTILIRCNDSGQTFQSGTTIRWGYYLEYSFNNVDWTVFSQEESSRSSTTSNTTISDYDVFVSRPVAIEFPASGGSYYIRVRTYYGCGLQIVSTPILLQLVVKSDVLT